MTKGLSACQGLMLESTEPRLSEPGGAHFACPDKVRISHQITSSPANALPGQCDAHHLVKAKLLSTRLCMPARCPSLCQLANIELGRACAGTRGAPGDHRGGRARGGALHKRAAGGHRRGPPAAAGGPPTAAGRTPAARPPAGRRSLFWCFRVVVPGLGFLCCRPGGPAPSYSLGFCQAQGF